MKKQSILKQLNKALRGSFLKFHFAETSQEEIITFEARMIANPYIDETQTGSFKDFYYSRIREVFKQMGYDVTFNNTGRIFWIHFKN